ncbi:DUF6507 family protein [Gordonia sp. NPDC003424]
MDLQPSEVSLIARHWNEADTVLTGAATTAGDSSGTWAPAVHGAVTAFADAWRDDITQLAAEAKTTSEVLHQAVAHYRDADDATAESMKRIQRSVAPPR